MPRTSKPKKPKLPPYVFIKSDTGNWFVRRTFPTAFRDKHGHIIHKQIVRRCFPHTEEQARSVSLQITLDLAGSAPPDIADQSFGQFVQQVLEAKKEAISARTHHDYDRLYRRYLARERLANTPVLALTPMVIQELYSILQHQGVSGNMVRKFNTMLSMCFNQGVAWGLLQKNPCRGVVLPRAIDRPLEILSPVEARKFVQACLANPKEYFVLLFALETGMRPSEYLALRWKDVDLQHATVSVTRAVAFGRKSGYVFKTPKTKASRRTIHITEQLCEMFRAHRERQLADMESLRKTAELPLGNRTKQGVNYQKRESRRNRAKSLMKIFKQQDLVFPSSTGTPMSARNVAFRLLPEICKEIGIERRSLYSLRHSCASLSLAAGVNVKAISEKLGHGGITITLQTYAHVLPSMRREATNALVATLYKHD